MNKLSLAFSSCKLTSQVSGQTNMKHWFDGKDIRNSNPGKTNTVLAVLSKLPVPGPLSSLVMKHQYSRFTCRLVHDLMN